MTNSAQNLEIMREAYRLFFAGEIDRFFEVFADDVELVEADSLPYGGVYKGKAAVIEGIRKVMTSWDKLALQIDVLAAEGDYVMAYGRFTATGLATGKTASFPLAEVWKLRDGKVVFLNPVYGDTQLASEVLGK